MKAILLSVRPQWCYEMENGRKTIEARKTFPVQLSEPFKCYIYMSSGFVPHDSKLFSKCGSVVAEFVCDKIFYLLQNDHVYEGTLPQTALTREQLRKYGAGKTVYGWHISFLQIYDKALDLSRFGLDRPPQSWCYVEDVSA